VVCAIDGVTRSRRIFRGESDQLDRIYDQAEISCNLFPIVATERIIAAGDVVSVGGLAATEIAADSRAASYRALPTRIVMTSAAGYRLAVVKPGGTPT
jgi:hypothetical protein